MYSLTIRQTRKDSSGCRLETGYKTTPIYTKEEAEKDGVQFVYWREWSGEKFVLTDDNYVLEVLTVNTVRAGSRESKRITMPKHQVFIGKYMQKKPLLWDIDYKAREAERTVKDKRVKLAVYVYVRMKIAGRPIDWDIITWILRPRNPKWKKYAQLTFAKHEVQEMVRKEVAEALVGGNLTPQRVAEEYNKLLALCHEKKDRENLRLTLERLTDLLAMMPAKQTVNTNVNMQAELPPNVAAMLDEAEAGMKGAIELKQADGASIEVVK